MEQLNVEVKVNQQIDVEIELHDIIDSINNLPIERRWSYFANMLNRLELDSDGLNVEQKQIIKVYLTSKLNKL